MCRYMGKCIRGVDKQVDVGVEDELVYFLDRFSFISSSLSLTFSSGFTVDISSLHTFFRVGWTRCLCVLGSDKVPGIFTADFHCPFFG